MDNKYIANSIREKIWIECLPKYINEKSLLLKSI